MITGDGYQRYPMDKKEGLVKGIITAAKQYYEKYHLAPRLAIVHLSRKEAPANIEILTVIRGWGPQPNEVDLGPVPEHNETPEPAPVARPNLAGNSDITAEPVVSRFVLSAAAPGDHASNNDASCNPPASTPEIATGSRITGYDDVDPDLEECDSCGNQYPEDKLTGIDWDNETGNMPPLLIAEPKDSL